MRSDMGKVILERPRYGNPNGIAKTAKTALRVRVDQDWDDLDFGPARQSGSPARLYDHKAKLLNDLMGPLKRFLQARAGRPWTKVEHEVRAAVDARSLAGGHLLSHLRQMVCTNTTIYRGKICDASRLSWGCGEVRGWYVHPRTGLLTYQGRK